MRLILASGNKGKMREFRSFFDEIESFRSSGVELVLASEIDGAKKILDSVDENGSSYEENALIKARSLADHYGEPTIADDSGIEVEHLGWAPGIRSARIVAGSDEDRTKWLLDNLRDVPGQDRRARFVACVVVALPESFRRSTGRDRFACEGIVNGKIAISPRGDGGFGYDPVFIPDGYDKTFGELPAEVKAAISHRAIAVKGIAKMMENVLKSIFVRGR